MILNKHVRAFIVSLPLSVAGLYWPAQVAGQCAGGACPAGSSAYEQAERWLDYSGGPAVAGEGSGNTGGGVVQRTAFACPGGKCGGGGGSLPAASGAPPAPSGSAGSSGKACATCKGGKGGDVGPIRKFFRAIGRAFRGFCARCRR